MRSRSAFRRAVVEYLTEGLGLDPGSVAIGGPPGKPRPDCGELFLCVWGAGRSYGIRTGLDTYLSTSLTLTKRFAGPIDRWDTALDAESDGLEEHLDGLISLLTTGQNDIRARTAALMGAGIDGTSEAPRVISDEDPQPVGSDWFEAEPGPGKGGGLIYGFKATVVYGGLRITHPVPTAEV